MTFKINKAFAVLAILASVTFSGGAKAAQDVVVTADGAYVVNTFGNCVRTMWDAPTDKCAPAAPVQATQYVTPKPHQLTDKSRSYLVFFDFDKSTLTPDAKEILSTLRKDAGNKNALTFEVTGHADRSGSDDYNLRLSERRAEAVKKELMMLGVGDENVMTQAKGESMPLVPTEDGVREPQNRRAEIVFGYRE